ncbi:MAG: GTP 3',8-cyclase MoaA [Candidatus Lokiarchaeota archaeon]|nr:GTP 3',8-cyclase MoaA [Candidatus Lokiarchaeota archaeon]MBD3338888.1 GTP 3',8-cyclase MoaA [Candidatus Lokiarchaeota archaeon]
MKDKCNREIKHIRLSVTSKCNFDCLYCDKEGFIPQTSELTIDEIKRVSKILANILQVKRIKLTGGEPLCRQEIVKIVKEINDLSLYDDISMTTNGYILEEKAKNLKKAGLNRVNVSLCSLDPETFKMITGANALEKVLRGLQKAKEVGLFPIKLNYVMLKGVNDNELDNMIEFSAQNHYILQIIELHQSSECAKNKNEFFNKFYHNIDPIIKNLESRAIETIIRGEMQNRKVFILPNSGVVETIKPSHDFCKNCTKLRVGCDGNLFGCLYRSDMGRNLKDVLNNQQSLEKYESIVNEVVNSRQPYY